VKIYEAGQDVGLLSAKHISLNFTLDQICGENGRDFEIVIMNPDGCDQRKKSISIFDSGCRLALTVAEKPVQHAR